MRTLLAIPWEAWTIVLPLLAAVAAFLLPKARLFGPTAAATTLALAGLTLRVWMTGPQRHRIGGWGAPLGIELQADGLSVVLLLMTAAIVIPAGFYARLAASRKEGETPLFWPLWLLLWGALNALFLSADLFNIYVSLELLSLAAVILACSPGGAALASGMRYLLVSLLGSLAYLLGVALQYGAYGVLDLELLGQMLEPQWPGGAAIALMVLGLALKTALFPLHFWLPAAHGNAAPPVSAVLSGLVIKATFYLLVRFWLVLFPAALSSVTGWLLGLLGAVAVIWGSVQALRQERIKYLLAYSSVAQIGYFFLFFPLTAAADGQSWLPVAQAGMIYLVLGHAAAKGAMFLAAGCLAQGAGSDRLGDIAGVAPLYPQALLAFALGGVTLMGLPPSGGFAAKWLLLRAALESGQWWWVPVIIVGGLLAAGYVFRVLRPPLFFLPADRRCAPVPRSQQTVSLLLAVFSVLLGLGGAFPFRLAEVGARFTTRFIEMPGLAQQDGWLLLVTLGSSLLAGIVIFFLGEQQVRLRTTLNLAAAIVKLLAVFAMLWGVFHGDSYELRWPVFYNLELVLRADPLAMLFVVLSAVLWLVTTVYAIGYLEGSPNRSRFFSFFSLCVTATVGLALAGNLLTFFIFYEMLTLATYPLVVHRGSPESIYAGDTYLRYTLVGGAVLLVGVVWLQTLAGPVEFSPGGVLPALPGLHLIPIFALLVGGLGVKAALVPLHGWLPIAMVAPAPVSALLHAVAVVKAGAFGIVRVVYDVYGIELTQSLGLTGPLAVAASVTIIYGSLRALAQDDLKRRLAYSTVSQLSYIALGVATIGPLSTVGGVVHLVHQGIMKITLFFCAGCVAETLGVHRIRDLRGVGRRLPWTMAAFTVAAFGMIGVPPMAGFVSKWYLGLGSLEAGRPWVIAVLAASSLLNAAYFLPILYAAWFRAPSVPWQPRPPASRLETDWRLLLPPLVTALMVMAMGLLAGLPLSPLGWVTLIVEQAYDVLPSRLF